MSLKKSRPKEHEAEMKRAGFLSQKIATKENALEAFELFARGKQTRKSIISFREHLDENIDRLIKEYCDETFVTPAYREFVINDNKPRNISAADVEVHVIQWMTLIVIEKLLCDTYIRNSCSCVKGRGTHDFVNLMRRDLKRDPDGTRYVYSIDIHHYFQNISHPLMKERLESKIKDKKLLHFLFEFIDSYWRGLPLGVKLSQILANFFLAKFDHDVQNLFGIANDIERKSYWRKVYVDYCIGSCRTERDAEELAKGIDYLNRKFDALLDKGMKYYYRFADNMVMYSSDKAFLHVIAIMTTMVLARDYNLQINRNWYIKPVDAGGVDVCGYVTFHDHRLLRKRNKKALCREVSKCKKKGMTPEETRLKCASRIGFATHANSNNLLRKLNINMEKRLGKVIKSHRVNIPFSGMRYDQKKTFAEIVCKDATKEQEYKILLIDYKIDDSILEKETVVTNVPDSQGVIQAVQSEQPKKRLAIRYKRITQTKTYIDSDGQEQEDYTFEKVKDANGNDTERDAEYYSYSGSNILIDQATNSFSHDDLPCPSVIIEATNKMGKKYLKFT